MVDTLKLAKDIYGGSGSNTENSSTSRSQKSTVTRTYGICTSNSVNGEVEVDINGTKSTLPCTISIEASEENPRSVIIMVSNNQGIVTGYAGWGDGIQAGVDTAQDAADAAQDTADAAKDAASSAQTAADDARKVATNYISIDDNEGITVGNMTEETLGKNTYIDANGFYVRDGETALASFTQNKIELGKSSRSCEIDMGNGMFTFGQNSGGYSAIDTETDPLMLSAGHAGNTAIYLYPNQGEGRINLEADGRETMVITRDLVNVAASLNALSLSVSNKQVSLSGHTHAATDITSGTLPVSRGGTGKTSGTFRGETVLFNNASQAMSDAITLSRDCTNFTYLDVYCKDNDGAYVHQRVYNPAVDRKFTVMSMFSNANSFFIKYKRFAIADTTTINTAQNSDGSCACGEYSGSFAQCDVLNIIRVVGVA